MDNVTRYQAMAAFYRRRAKMVGEHERFWMTEADSWATRLSSESVDTLQDKTVVRGVLSLASAVRSQTRPSACRCAEVETSRTGRKF